MGIVLRAPDQTVGMVSGDARQTSDVLATIDKVRKQGVGIVFINHNVRHALAVGDWFTGLNRGQTLAAVFGGAHPRQFGFARATTGRRPRRARIPSGEPVADADGPGCGGHRHHPGRDLDAVVAGRAETDGERGQRAGAGPLGLRRPGQLRHQPGWLRAQMPAVDPAMTPHAETTAPAAANPRTIAMIHHGTDPLPGPMTTTSPSAPIFPCAASLTRPGARSASTG